jgi:hypothetical protein
LLKRAARRLYKAVSRLRVVDGGGAQVIIDRHAATSKGLKGRKGPKGKAQ